MAQWEATSRPDRRRAGWLVRLGQSLPSPRLVFIGSIVTGAAMAGSTLVGLYLLNGWLTPSRTAIVLLYFSGAAAGFAPAMMLANMVTAGRGRIARFALASTILLLSVHTATALIFALQYRVFYAHWHASFPSLIWFFQLFGTVVAAVYQFTVGSLYLYYPVAPVLFAGFGAWHALQTPVEDIKPPAAGPKRH